MSTTTIDKTLVTWSKEPDQARGTPTVTAQSESRQAVIHAGPFTWRADLPAPLGGTNQAPSPTALLLSALAGCAIVFTLDTLGPQLGIRIDAVRASVSCDTDARGLLGMENAAPDLSNVAVDVTVDSPDGEAAVAELARVWQERCPVYLAIRKPNDVAVRFRVA